mmetsp:Transcript_6621/g.5948  ORF Transcript_6621/g.5948 Transcript_6621/m.5948 type:complete len:86 (+) Transcript_6621:1304-1561(+)
MFRKIDKDMSGFISKGEFIRYFVDDRQGHQNLLTNTLLQDIKRKMGAMTQQDIFKLYELTDRDRNRRVTSQEFTDFVRKVDPYVQ